jgi:hypothetical protein
MALNYTFNHDKQQDAEDKEMEVVVEGSCDQSGPLTL